MIKYLKTENQAIGKARKLAKVFKCNVSVYYCIKGYFARLERLNSVRTDKFTIRVSTIDYRKDIV